MIRFWILTTATLLVISGCSKMTPIKTIVDDPARLNGKWVEIAGVVTKAPATPGPESFEVNDGTGKVFVCSKEHVIPRVGTKVVVKGTYYASIFSKTQEFAAVVEGMRPTR